MKKLAVIGVITIGFMAMIASCMGGNVNEINVNTTDISKVDEMEKQVETEKEAIEESPQLEEVPDYQLAEGIDRIVMDTFVEALQENAEDNPIFDSVAYTIENEAIVLFVVLNDTLLRRELVEEDIYNAMMEDFELAYQSLDEATELPLMVSVNNQDATIQYGIYANGQYVYEY